MADNSQALAILKAKGAPNTGANMNAVMEALARDPAIAELVLSGMTNSDDSKFVNQRLDSLLAKSAPNAPMQAQAAPEPQTPPQTAPTRSVATAAPRGASPTAGKMHPGFANDLNSNYAPPRTTPNPNTGEAFGAQVGSQIPTDSQMHPGFSNNGMTQPGTGGEKSDIPWWIPLLTSIVGGGALYGMSRGKPETPKMNAPNAPETVTSKGPPERTPSPDPGYFRGAPQGPMLALPNPGNVSTYPSGAPTIPPQPRPGSDAERRLRNMMKGAGGAR